MRKQNFDHKLVSRSYSCCALDINSMKYMEIWTWIAKQNKDKNLFTEEVHCRESISTREFDTKVVVPVRMKVTIPSQELGAAQFSIWMKKKVVLIDFNWRVSRILDFFLAKSVAWVKKKGEKNIMLALFISRINLSCSPLANQDDVIVSSEMLTDSQLLYAMDWKAAQRGQGCSKEN